MAMPMDHAFDSHNVERLRAAEILLLGRNTYEGFKAYWPSIAGDEESDAVNREISRRNDAIEKVVVSDTLTPEQTDPWRATTRIVRRAEAHERIAELKDGDGGEILVFGSGTLWNGLLAAGLVDELHLMVGPVVLGDGTPAFTTPPATRLSLIDTLTFDGSDNVVIRYAAS